MVWVRSPVYFYNRNGTYYFSRAVPSDLRHRFPKRKDRGLPSCKIRIQGRQISSYPVRQAGAILGQLADGDDLFEGAWPDGLTRDKNCSL